MKKKQEHRKPQSDLKKTVLKPGSGVYSVYLFAIILISLIAYLPVFHNGFVNWDADQYILENPLIRSINLGEIFSGYFMGNYHPLTILVLALEFKIFGISPMGYHVVNLLIHLLNIILVFRTVELLSSKKEVALIACLFFACTCFWHHCNICTKNFRFYC